jgi:hypothetical protein
MPFRFSESRRPDIIHKISEKENNGNIGDNAWRRAMSELGARDQ